MDRGDVWRCGDDVYGGFVFSDLLVELDEN